MIVGAGQVLRRDPPDDVAVEPPAMIAGAPALAADDGGSRAALLSDVQIGARVEISTHGGAR